MSDPIPPLPPGGMPPTPPPPPPAPPPPLTPAERFRLCVDQGMTTDEALHARWLGYAEPLRRAA